MCRNRLPIRTRAIARILGAAIFVASAVQLSFGVVGNKTATKDGVSATLFTTVGDVVVGRWEDANVGDRIRWSVNGLSAPLEFNSDYVSTITITRDTPLATSPEGFRCELTAGDVIYGTPLGLDHETLRFDMTGVGPVDIRREAIGRLSAPSDRKRLLFCTTGSLEDWKNVNGVWSQASGSVVSGKANSSLDAEVQLPSKVAIELNLSWDQHPDFRVVFGSPDDWETGFKIETWRNHVVVVAQDKNHADVASAMSLVPESKRIAMQLFVDFEQDELIVHSQNGAVCQVELPRALRCRGVSILDRRGNLSCDAVRISSWGGVPPVKRAVEESCVQTVEDEIIYGNISQWDTQHNALVLENASSHDRLVKPGNDERVAAEASSGDEEEEVVPETEASGDRAAVGDEAEDSDPVKSDPVKSDPVKSDPVKSDPVKSNPAETDPVKSDNAGRKPDERRIALSEVRHIFFGHRSQKREHTTRAVCQNGVTLQGALLKVTDGSVWLKCPDIAQPLRLPIADLLGLSFGVLNKPPHSPAESSATLRILNSTIAGSLSDAKMTADESCLHWQPTCAFNAVALDHHASGSITYVVVDRKQAVEQQVRTKLAERRTPTIYLNAGDSVAGEIERIDELGMKFKSPSTEATFLKHEDVKAATLVADFKPVPMTQPQLDRLLTVPRIQQDYPPKHLVISTDQDILRGRVVAMDQETLTAEVRLNMRRIPRDRVAAIVWLGEVKNNREESDEESPAEAVPDDEPSATMQLQAVDTSGARMTFQPREVKAGIVYGTSPILGECRAEVTRVKRLFFGDAIAEDVEKLAHHRLTLHQATQPRFLTAGDQAPRSVGQESALVGKPAPPIQLQLVDESSFRLSDHRGRIVVLDFWATWCGPCIQWLPQLEQIVGEFPEEKVVLVTVNLSEDKESISAVLQRLDLDPLVAMDIDGVVADAYQATAIPQTVIVDSNGIIDRLFIGGGSQAKTPLRKALQRLISSDN